MKQLHMTQSKNLSQFTVLSFGLTGEASFVGGVSVEEGISLDFNRPNYVDVGGYVSYGAVVGLTAGVSSGVAVSLSKSPEPGQDNCGAGFGISAGFDVGGVGVGGGIAIDPTLPCRGNLEDLLNLNAMEGISIGVSAGVGPPVPVSVTANFTSTTTFKILNGRLSSSCKECGGKGQRPCSVTERYPSCDQGLAENCGVCS